MASKTERYTAAEIRSNPELLRRLFSRSERGKHFETEKQPKAIPKAAATKRPNAAAAPVSRSRYDCIVGIDPGRHTGFAIIDHRGSAGLQLYELTFWKAIDTMEALVAQHGQRVLFVIEDPNQNRPVFAKEGANQAKAINKIAQDVGRNKEQAWLLLEWCRLKGALVEAIKPVEGKWSEEQFFRYAGIREKSEHARDAGRFILGR